MKQKRLQYKIAVWLTMGLMVMDPLVVPLAYAENPIEVDRNAPQHRQAQVGQTANGITLVNITGPTAGGVSRNDYTNFNVPQHGVILNNSFQMANTSLAGYVPGNANLMRGSASVIVNEVTSHNPTNMNGFIEVAGRKASVVVANPNGITVDGGGFINTDRAVLTTGKPEYDPNGNLNAYRVEQGSIAINGKGLNAKESNSLQILTEAAQVNAGVWANAVETRTGKNLVDAKSLESKALGSSKQIGLDVSAIGGMYANSITMKGTNDGLGVNVKGTLSSVHATTISADGMIQVDGGITSNGQTSISGHAISVGQDGVVQGDNGLSIESQSSMTNHGLVNSNGTTDIRATSVDNAENGRIYGNTLSIKADTVSNHTDATIEARYKRAADALTQAKETLDTEWNADITAYKTKEELQAHRNRIQELTKTYDKAQEAMTKVQKELDSHKSGTIASRDHMDIQANEIHNNGNALLYSGNTMNLTGSHVIENKGATIQSGGEMNLTTSNLVNDNASFGMKRVSDGITKHGDKLKVDDPHHPEENQVFDVSEFPGYTGKGGYGVAHKVPVKQADGTIKMVDKGVPPVKNFTLIRSEEEHTHTEVTNNQPGVISAGGDIVINGASSNINSKIASAGRVIFNGAHETVSDTTSDKVFKTGTTQVSEAKRVHKGHGLGHKWRRYWDPEVFMTPSIEEQNIQPIGTMQEHAEDTIAEANKRKVHDSLYPFGTGNQGKSSIGNVTIEGLKLPTQAIYNIHPDITANALIETDSAFTNRKKFVSSEYMLNALANDPERRMKRLGDGFYEQGLINSQILSATGKPYLEGYTDNESEYKALLEAGIAYGKQYKLTPGITLSEEQMKSITTDMVWLETKTIVVNGQPQQVLYPKVYLAKQSANQIDAMGAVVSGKSIIANTDSTFKNSGKMIADTIVVQANTVDNTGRFNANTVAIGATDSIRNTGAIHGNDSVTLRANNDINVEAETYKLANQDVLMQQGRIGVSNPKGTIDIHSNKDVHLTGAVITGGDEGNISITSANTVNVDTKKLSAKKDMTLNATNYLRTDRGTEIGTQILGDGNVTIVAKNDVNIRQGVINSEHGVTTIAAGNDVNIENGNTYSRDQYGLQYKEKGLLSRTVNTIRKDYEHTGVTASTIGGNTIQVGANHDVNVTGSNVLGTGDVAISVGNKIRTNSAEDSSRNDIYQHSKKKGLMGAGLGFTIGSKKITDTYDGRYTTQEASNIGSTNGVINVTAGDTIHSTTTNYFSNNPVSLTAADVDIDGKHNSSHVVQTHEEKRSGLTVSVGGQVVSALNTAQQLGKRANSRKTSALSAFEYGEAANSIKHVYNDAKAYSKIKPVNLLDKEREVLSKANELNKNYQLEHPEIENAVHPDVQNAIDKEQKYKQEQARKDRLLNINVSIGSSKYKQRNELNEEQYIGSSIGSKTKVDITANSNDMSKGNIHITGSTVEAPVVNVSASNNLRMDAGTNTVVQRDDYTSSGWSIGATVSPHGSGVIGLDANVYKGKENALETTKTHTGTVILGKQVNTVSGNNTEIIGSKVISESVTTKVGHDLKIESLQDTNDYHKISKNKGIYVSYGMSGPARVGFDNSRGTTDSHYASVTNQAGIYAGDSGYNINVKNRISLIGGRISGNTNNSFIKSKELYSSDIKNEAFYITKKNGFSVSVDSSQKPLDKQGTLNIIPLIKKNNRQGIRNRKSSITHSVITGDKINVDKTWGDEIYIDINKGLNQLDKIFDKRKIEEKEILVDKLSILLNKSIGDIAYHMEHKTSSDVERRKWADGGEYKMLLHAIGGGIISEYSGGNFTSGAVGAASDDGLKAILKNIKNESARRAVEYVIVSSIGKFSGIDVDTALSQQYYSIEYNRYGHRRYFDGEIILKDGKFYQYKHGQLVNILLFEHISSIIAWEENPDDPNNGQDFYFDLDKNGKPILSTKKKIDGNFTSIGVRENSKVSTYFGADNILWQELKLVKGNNEPIRPLSLYGKEDTFKEGFISGLDRWIDSNVDLIKKIYDNPEKVKEDVIFTFNVIKDNPELIKEIPPAIWESIKSNYNKLTDPNVSQLEKGRITGELSGDISISLIPIPGGVAKTAITKSAPRLVALSNTMKKISTPVKVIRNEVINGKNVANVHWASKLTDDIDLINNVVDIERKNLEKVVVKESVNEPKAKLVKSTDGKPVIAELDTINIHINESNVKNQRSVGKVRENDISEKINLDKGKNQNINIPSNTTKFNRGNNLEIENISKTVYTNGEQFLSKNKSTLKPDIVYFSNGYKYETDSKGRIISAKGNLRIPSEVVKENIKRNKSAQLKVGGTDRIKASSSDRGDHGGHLIGHQFGGSGELDNLVAMSADLNQGAYKKLENMWAKALESGKSVFVDIKPNYSGNSLRPDGFEIVYKIDGIEMPKVEVNNVNSIRK